MEPFVALYNNQVRLLRSLNIILLSAIATAFFIESIFVDLIVTLLLFVQGIEYELLWVTSDTKP